MIKKIFELIKVYRFSLLIILVYEFLYMFRGYKGNILAIRNNKFRTDNIPCPYFFLEMISNFLKKKNIKSLIDLGCGSGRVLYFFNQKHNIKLFGIEYYQESYKLCNNMFSSNNNIKIINNDFLKVSISQLVADCYFLNDPLKNFNSFKFIIEKILKINKKKKFN